MALCKTEGLILRTRRQGETSKILIVYTRDFGKISLMAKGARSTKSRYWGVLEPLTHISLVFYRKENRELQFLSQADILKSFTPLHSQLGKMILALMMCELVDKVEIDEAVNPQLYSLLLDSMRGLAEADSGARNVVRSFQLKLISLLGYEPHLVGCAQCGKTETRGQVSFEIDSGRYSCRDCDARGSDRMSVSNSVIKMMRWFQQVAVTDSPKARVSARLGREIDVFLQTYLQYHVEGLAKLKSVTFLEQIGNSLKKF